MICIHECTICRVVYMNLKLWGIDKCLGGAVYIREAQIYIEKH